MKKTYLSVVMIFLYVLLMKCDAHPFRRSEKIHKIHRVSPGKIVIDGKFEDWKSIKDLTTDVGSKERGKFPPRIDLKSVKCTYDGDNFYLLLEAKPVHGAVIIYVDSDGSKSTGVDSLVIGQKMQVVKFQQGWDYVIKLTYAPSYLTSQVEKIEKVKYGYKTKLVGKVRNSVNDPSYVGVGKRFQEVKVPLQILKIKPPTEIALLFMEGTGGMFTKYDKHCQLIKVKIE